jgi:phosphoglycolate phosphatase
MKLILFDIDGTLLLVKGAGREAKARAMVEIFGTEAGARTHHFGGKTDWRILLELLEAHGHTAESLGEVMAVYQERIAFHLEDIIASYAVEVCPGAHELVAALRGREDIALGIVTGNVSTTAPLKLRAGGFDPAWFCVGAYGSESTSRNDLPRLAVERACALLERTFAPQDVLVIGDTVADIECARAIGAVAIGVQTGFEEVEALIASKPDYLLPDLTHFLARVAI